MWRCAKGKVLKDAGRERLVNMIRPSVFVNSHLYKGGKTNFSNTYDRR